MASPGIPSPEEKTAKRIKNAGELLVALLVAWKTNLLFIFGIWFCWHERFWRDPLYRFTCPLLLFLTSLPMLDRLGFSFVPFLRRLRGIGRRR